MKEIASALVKAQRQFGPALKSSSNPHFRSKYADLSACVEAVIDALNDNGIFLTQHVSDNPDGVIVETVFLHESGERLDCGKLFVPASKKDAQGFGSAETYARRYSLMAACGIAPEDDDGNAATASKARGKGLVIGARDGIGDDLPQDWKDYLRDDLAPRITEMVSAGNVKAANDLILKDNLDETQFTYLYNQLGSKVRSALKAKEPA